MRHTQFDCMLASMLYHDDKIVTKMYCGYHASSGHPEPVYEVKQKITNRLDDKYTIEPFKCVKYGTHFDKFI